MATFDRSFTTSQVRLVHARRAGASGTAHEHAEAMIFVPLSGSLTFAVGDAAYVADTAHALVVRGGVLHRHAATAGVEYFIAYVDDARLAARVRRGAPAFRFANTALVRELAAELLAATAGDDAEVIAAITVLLCAQAARADELRHVELAPDDPRLARAIELARSRYREGVSTRELARAAAMSPRAFERALAQACGTTPRRLVEDLRMTEARTRLEAGRESVTAVAFDLGYRSLSHFVRRFRAAFGTTPTGIRREPSTRRRGKASGSAR